VPSGKLINNSPRTTRAAWLERVERTGRRAKSAFMMTFPRQFPNGRSSDTVANPADHSIFFGVEALYHIA
jgi:hypothetical protein